MNTDTGKLGKLLAVCGSFNAVMAVVLIVNILVTDKFPPRQNVALSKTNGLVGLTPDGKTLITKTIPDGESTHPAFGPIQLWDVPTGKQRAAYLSDVPLYGLNTNVVLSPDGQLLAVICKDGRVMVLEVETGEALSEIPFIEGNVKWMVGSNPLVVFSPDSKRMAFYSWSKGTEYINLWERKAAKSNRLVERGCRTLGCFSADGCTLAIHTLYDRPGENSGAESSWVTRTELWDLGLRKVRHTCFQHGEIWHTVFAPDGRLVVVTSKQEARFIDAATGQSLLTLRDVRSLGFFPDGKRFLTVGLGSEVKCRDLATGTIEFDYRWLGILDLILPDGRSLISRRADGAVEFWDVPPRKPLWWVLLWTTAWGVFGLWNLTYVNRFVRQAKAKPPATAPLPPG